MIGLFEKQSRFYVTPVQGRQIAINSLKDEAETDKILKWLQREINSAWAQREEIEPSYEGAPKPKIIEILKLLPQTNCRDCGEPTCMVFATRLADGVLSAEQCPALTGDEKQTLKTYMSEFYSV